MLDNIFIRFGTNLYRQVVGIPMGTNCAPLVADLFLFCYERDFMMSLSDDKQADVIDAVNTTSRYLDDILNINNVYFDKMVSQIYPSELQLNKANTPDTEAAFLDLHLSISNDIVSTKIYDKLDDFDFEVVNFPFLDVDLLCFCSVLCLLCLCARLFICALWSPAGKGLTSWLSLVVSYCEFATFPLVSWARCGT